MAPAVYPSRRSCARNEKGVQAEDLPCEAWSGISKALHLSLRELTIVKGICSSQNESSMAEALAVSPEVVYRMTQRIYVKLHVGSRMELRLKVVSAYLGMAQPPYRTADLGRPEKPSLSVAFAARPGERHRRNTSSFC